jgi:hypothetical protein
MRQTDSNYRVNVIKIQRFSSLAIPPSGLSYITCSFQTTNIKAAGPYRTPGRGFVWYLECIYIFIIFSIIV